jgi:formylmethanofuran dehydrogenase subunit A
MGHELLLKNGLVVTVDDSLGELQYADVLSRDGVIIAVGSGLSTSTTDAEVMDCRGRLAIPGLVDSVRGRGACRHQHRSGPHGRADTEFGGMQRKRDNEPHKSRHDGWHQPMRRA